MVARLAARMRVTRPVVPQLARAVLLVYTVDYDLEIRAFNAQMKAADKSGARAVLLLGDDEWARGEAIVKDLRTGTQETVAMEAIADALDRVLNEPEETRIP
jgi:histidyl-tRNA synthetase